MSRPKLTKFKVTDTFWKNFYKLSSDQKESVRKAWTIFKDDPFDPRLGTHVIKRLSSLRKGLVYSVWVEGDLRCLFEIKGDVVVTLNVGTHDIYKP
jgi:mRNA-degrading endonuclease RelE of RelBE toxin-antitoxin system